MASVMSASPSVSGYDFQADSTGDPDEFPWTILSQQAPGSSASSHTGGAFSFSSAPGSLNSWAMVNNSHGRQMQASPQPGLSPGNLDFDPSPSFPTSSYGDATGTTFSVMSGPAEGQYMSGGESYLTANDMLFSGAPDPFGEGNFTPDLGEDSLSLPKLGDYLGLTARQMSKPCWTQCCQICRSNNPSSLGPMFRHGIQQR
jgi:hypothetical protein